MLHWAFWFYRRFVHISPGVVWPGLSCCGESRAMNRCHVDCSAPNTFRVGRGQKKMLRVILAWLEHHHTIAIARASGVDVGGSSAFPLDSLIVLILICMFCCTPHNTRFKAVYFLP